MEVALRAAVKTFKYVRSPIGSPRPIEHQEQGSWTYRVGTAAKRVHNPATRACRGFNRIFRLKFAAPAHRLLRPPCVNYRCSIFALAANGNCQERTCKIRGRPPKAGMGRARQNRVRGQIPKKLQGTSQLSIMACWKSDLERMLQAA